MLGLLTRLFRVFWRQDNEGSRAGADIIAFPTAVMAAPAPAAAPVAFIRLAAETSPAVSKTSSRQLAARLQSVQRLNPPASRPRTKAAASQSGKPKPVAAGSGIKRARSVKPGVVLDRINAYPHRARANVVDLCDVRRSRQIDAIDLALAQIFN